MFRKRHIVDQITGKLRQAVNPCKTGGHARANRFTTPCEEKRRVAAAHFTALLRSDLRSPVSPALPQSLSCSMRAG